MRDLFRKTNKDLIYEHIKEKKWVRSSEIQKFGTENYINEPQRYCRKLAEENKIKRMSKAEVVFRFHIKEGVWKIGELNS